MSRIQAREEPINANHEHIARQVCVEVAHEDLPSHGFVGTCYKNTWRPLGHKPLY